MLCVPFLHGWWWSCGQQIQANVQEPVKQNASPQEQSEAPRPRWKPGQEQHPGPENQDSQHMLKQPRGSFLDTYALHDINCSQMPACTAPIAFRSWITLHKLFSDEFCINCSGKFDHDKGQKSAISGRRLHWRLSTGLFCFFSSVYVQFSKTSPLKSGESSEKSSEKIASNPVTSVAVMFFLALNKLFSDEFCINYTYLLHYIKCSK